MQSPDRFFATAAKGTEPALRDELKWLRFKNVRADRGGVHFEGDLLEGLRACLWSRCAIRVLMPMTSFACRDEASLYEGMRAVEWESVLSPKHTLAVSSYVRDSQLRHSGYVALKTKDAIVDRLRDRFGERPDVSRADADVEIFVRIVKDQAEAFVDLAGRSLHMRGYRAQAMEAPLKETLAASLLWLIRWDQRVPFVDPMCGSGTIAIEAASWAARIAPGLSRAQFGVERWALWSEEFAAKARDLREDAKARRVHEGLPEIIAGDIEPEAIDVARRNAELAGVKIDFHVADVAKFAGTSPPGVVVTNPPYGERLSSNDVIVEAVKHSFRKLNDHRLGVLATTDDIARAMRRRPDSVREVFNGDLACGFFMWDATTGDVPRAGEDRGRARRQGS